MVLVNVNGVDTIDASDIMLVLDAKNFDASAAKNDNRFISLTRNEIRNGNSVRMKIKTYIVTKDNLFYGIQLSPKVFIRKYYNACAQFGHSTHGLIKISPTDYYMLPNILYLTENLSKTQKEECDRLERLCRVFKLTKEKVKSHMLVEGKNERFMIKTSYARTTIITHIRELNRKEF